MVLSIAAQAPGWGPLHLAKLIVPARQIVWGNVFLVGWEVIKVGGVCGTAYLQKKILRKAK